MIIPAMAASKVIVFMSPLYAFTDLPRTTPAGRGTDGLKSDPPSSTIKSEFSIFVPTGPVAWRHARG